MQSLNLQAFKNIETGTTAALLINGSNECTYYQEVCPQGIVSAGQDQHGMYWASYTLDDTVRLIVSECPCLDDALNDLGANLTNAYLDDQLTAIPWHPHTTGY